MKEEIAFRQSKSLRHTRVYFDIFNALAEWAVSEAGGKDKVFGTKPGVADYKPTDLGTEASKAVDANIRNMPQIQALLEKILPGYGEMVATGAKSTMSLLRGEIPADVQAAVRRGSAFQSLQGGYAGSGMSKALTARDFGRTSLDLQQMGGNAAQRWMQITQGSASPYVVTAPQQGAQTERNNLYDMAVKQFKYNVDAAPDPGAAGVFNLQTALGSMAASFGMSSALGGMKGSGAAAGTGGSGGGYQGWGMEGRGNASSASAYPYNWWGTAPGGG